MIFKNVDISPLIFQGHYAQVQRGFLEIFLCATLCFPLKWLRFGAKTDREKQGEEKNNNISIHILSVSHY
jgi:hypothetical protein